MGLRNPPLVWALSKDKPIMLKFTSPPEIAMVFLRLFINDVTQVKGRMATLFVTLSSKVQVKQFFKGDRGVGGGAIKSSHLLHLIGELSISSY